jgi:hypothetical protein
MMRKIKYFIVLIIVVIVALFFVPNSLLLRPLINHLKSKMEENWKCKIGDRKTSFDLLKGTMRLENLDIKTVRNTDISWHLKIKGVAVDVDYSSIMHGSLILNEVILDDVFLEMDKKPSKKIHTQRQKTQDNPKKGVLIKYLLISGSFEVNHRLDSVLTDSIRMKNVKIRRKDVSLVGTPKDLLFPLMKETKNKTKFVIGKHGSEIGTKKGGRITISEEITDPSMKARGLKKGDTFVDE